MVARLALGRAFRVAELAHGTRLAATTLGGTRCVEPCAEGTCVDVSEGETRVSKRDRDQEHLRCVWAAHVTE